MSVEIRQIERAIEAFEKIRAQQLPLGGTKSHNNSPGRASVNNLFKATLVDVGLDLNKLGKLLSEDQSQTRTAINETLSMVANDQNRKVLSQQELLRFKLAAEHLGGFQIPFPQTGHLIGLNEASYISQQPPNAKNESVFLGSGVAPNDNWVKFSIDITHGTFDTHFLFVFAWTNETDRTAVVNASTSLVLNGACVAKGGWGLIDGEIAYASVTARLAQIHGWNTSVGYYPPASSSWQNLVYIVGSGAGLLNPTGSVGLPVQSVNETARLGLDLVSVPPQSTALFTVDVQAEATFWDPSSDQGTVIIDFGSDDYMITCPFMLLEVVNAAHVPIFLP